MVFWIRLGVVAAVVLLTVLVNGILALLQLRYVAGIAPVQYKNQLQPQPLDGRWVFTTDGDFRVMTLTDVHIGGGWMSFFKDRRAIDCVVRMVTAEQPDLVAVTGDIAYPVPFQSGTFNNKTAARLFGRVMQNLGVYWAPVLGNHDTESYAVYNRRYIGKYYQEQKFAKAGSKSYCLFRSGPEGVDGVGNYTVAVENRRGAVTQALFFTDTGSYVDGDYLGFMWKYDGMHKNQMDWYRGEVEALTAHNRALGAPMPKSLMFFHIPIAQYKTAWEAYKENGYKDTGEVQVHYGGIGEKGGLFPSLHPDNVFDTLQQVGSTRGTFCGHDHLNNLSVTYKGIRLTYGLSVDYLAYIGIKNYGAQRGFTRITVHPDGSFDCQPVSYYQKPFWNGKEQVQMTPYYPPEKNPNAYPADYKAPIA